MIGLEGSGFTICLGVILLLTGIVMYYCKSKITACETRMNTMLNLITDLHSEVNTLKMTQTTAVHSAMYGGSGPMTGVTQDVEEYESDSESGGEEESDSEISEEEEVETQLEGQGEDTVKTVDAMINPFETHPYKELIPSSSTISAEVVNESSESEGDTEEDETPKQVKVVDLGQIEELAIEDLNMEEEEEDEDEEEDEESSEGEPAIDYAKMQVTALKKLASERQLAPNVHKLRKQELVNLLQGN